MTKGLTADLTPPGVRCKAIRYSGLISVIKIVFTAITTAAIATRAPPTASKTLDAVAATALLKAGKSPSAIPAGTPK
jgi:hypothetical protein